MAGCQTWRSRPNRAALWRNPIVTTQAATIINDIGRDINAEQVDLGEPHAGAPASK